MRPDSRTLIQWMRKKRSLEENIYGRPFFKWAGGKNQLLSEFDERLPEDLRSGVLDRYVEPFVGGGAVFFFIIQLFPIKEAILCDVNKELILTYRVVKVDAESLICRLKSFQEEYDSLDEQGRQEMFYRVRDALNEKKTGFEYNIINDTTIERAAELLFLNKTCFNGLFRLNSKGGFNVPFGRYKNPDVVHEANLRIASKLLTNTKIIQGDFSECLQNINDKTFVYIDPPYKPLNKSSGFTSYSEDCFRDEDQVRLSDFFVQADRIGAKVMLSNSDPKNEDPEDEFFDELYKQFRIERVMAKRIINSVAEKRGAIRELIIMNYSD